MFLLLLGLYFNFLPLLVTSTGHGSGVWKIAAVHSHRHYSSIYTVDIYMVDISTYTHIYIRHWRRYSVAQHSPLVMTTRVQNWIEATHRPRGSHQPGQPPHLVGVLSINSV